MHPYLRYLRKAAGYDESKHPRDESGRWENAGGGGGKTAPPGSPWGRGKPYQHPTKEIHNTLAELGWKAANYHGDTFTHPDKPDETIQFGGEAPGNGLGAGIDQWVHVKHHNRRAGGGMPSQGGYTTLGRGKGAWALGAHLEPGSGYPL